MIITIFTLLNILKCSDQLRDSEDSESCLNQETEYENQSDSVNVNPKKTIYHSGSLFFSTKGENESNHEYTYNKSEDEVVDNSDKKLRKDVDLGLNVKGNVKIVTNSDNDQSPESQKFRITGKIQGEGVVNEIGCGKILDFFKNFVGNGSSEVFKNPRTEESKEMNEDVKKEIEEILRSRMTEPGFEIRFL